MGEVEPFSGEGWALAADVSAFVSLLCAIAVGNSTALPIGTACGSPLSAAVPAFVWRLIKNGRSPEFARHLSFVDIVNHLKENGFQITAGVNSDEVSAFVSWVESREQPSMFNPSLRLLCDTEILVPIITAHLFS
jgi:hypothetical protein